MKKYLYLVCTMDKYELPIAVADSPTELAKMVGANPKTIISAIYHERTKGKKSKYKKVEVEEYE